MTNSAINKKFWREQIKHRAILALGNKCTLCGNSFEDCCYDFHHMNPQEKDFTITQINMNGAKSWLLIRDELKKCALVCSNCHRLIHNGYATIENHQYFNNEYYDWDLTNYTRIDHNTLKPVDSICPNCGQQKSNKAKLCQKCFSALNTKLNIDREELKQLIRTESFVAIGKKYEVTDNAIKKRCKVLCLPSTKKEINSYSDTEWEKI